MSRPPRTIDNAKVLQVADLSDTTPTRRTRHIVGGQAVEDIARLAIAQYEPGGGVYLLYCDAEWNTVTDTYHDDIASAVAQAEFEFGQLEFVEIDSQ